MTDGLLMNQLRGLIMDTVRRANSGHTGGALSSLDFAMLLYRDVLRYDPDDPTWLNRDRFVLSAGHESALLYSLLHMIGYLELDDLQNFRQLGSRTPGHPEVGLTPGVECTSGPLGQGVAMAVGMAVAEEMLRARLGGDIVNHDTYCLCGDGDLQEPVALGACALAGHWRLGRLVMYYDRNRVQISGGTERVDSTEVDQLFTSFGWHVLTIDGHDHDAIREALAQALLQTDQPTLIIGNTTMAHGTASMEGSAATHGAPLPPEEIAATKKKLGLDPEASFQVTEEALTELRRRQPRLRDKAAAWREHLKEARAEQEFDARWRAFFEPLDPAQLPWPRFEPGASIATRKAFGQVLDAVAEQLPGLVGGSADLEPSNNTANFAKRYGDFGAQRRDGRSLAYGVREFPMGAINNGIALHGGLRPFGATFLVFTDYERPALRLRALQQLPAIGVYTHDSIFVGEDGPTHQPVEQNMALRLIPGLMVYRPADAIETTLALEQILGGDRPAALLLGRQGVPVLPKEYHRRAREGVPRGGYVLKEAAGEPDVTIFTCGSEVALALKVDGLLADLDIKVVSLPCWELFFEQPEDYRATVLEGDSGLRVSLEAGTTLGWERFTGRWGLNIGVDRFGWSAPGEAVATAAGLQAEQVAKRIKAALVSPDTRRTASS